MFTYVFSMGGMIKRSRRQKCVRKFRSRNSTTIVECRRTLSFICHQSRMLVERWWRSETAHKMNESTKTQTKRHEVAARDGRGVSKARKIIFSQRRLARFPWRRGRLSWCRVLDDISPPQSYTRFPYGVRFWEAKLSKSCIFSL